MNNTEIAKFNMIEQQIRPWEVLDHQVLSTLEKLNRDDFVPQAYKGLAYADCQIPLANGVRMLPPTVEGRLLQALLIDADDLVLEIGSGSGYVTACLAQLAGQVTSLDADAEIAELARANIVRCGIDNVEFDSMSLAQLDADQRYDAIAVTASLPSVPQNLKQALKSGGRMFVIVGDSPVMEALSVTRVSSTEWITQSLFETDIPRLKQQAS
jgi:protein-L-isoaspartate(D-aspartate) O-methyltransferase